MRMKVLGVVGVVILTAAHVDAACGRVIPVVTGNHVIAGASGQSTEASLRVRMAQSELGREGLYSGKVDGVSGPATKWAIAEFQQREGLNRTGRLDTATRDRMVVNALRMNSWSSDQTVGEIDPSSDR